MSAHAVGSGAAFGLNAASFAASAALPSGLRAAEAPRPVPSVRMWAEARRGVGVVVADRVLRALAVAQALAALSAGVTSALLVVLVRSHLHASAGYGIALGAIGAGAFAGPLVLSRLPARDGHARLVVGAFGLRGLVDLTLASVSDLPGTLGALVA